MSESNQITKNESAWGAIKGRVAPPLILWFLGVPGSLCVVLWLLFWRHS